MRAALLVSATLLAAPIAHAQSIQNDQYQAGDATAHVDVETGAATYVGATAVANGNAASSAHENANATIDTIQHMDGDANAATHVTAWSADGVAAASAAIANGVTAASRGGDQEIRSTQLAHGDASASTELRGGSVDYASASASASGNVGAVSQEHGQVRVIAAQESTSSITASADADHCCVAGQAASGAIASANNLSIGGETATVLADARQSANGEHVAARVDLYVGFATDVSGNATANANAATIDNQWGYVNARIDQRAAADISADSYVTLGGDFLGFGTAGAYGVGNQAVVANVGSDTVIDTLQVNDGDVSANAALAGEGGQSALASAAAYGNSVTGSLCAYCDNNVPSLTASNHQSNSGDVSTSALVNAPYASTVAASATAIGNAATYQVSGPGSRP